MKLDLDTTTASKITTSRKRDWKFKYISKKGNETASIVANVQALYPHDLNKRFISL
jgi:hypothetical protein